jgi:hypothetical protein
MMTLGGNQLLAKGQLKRTKLFNYTGDVSGDLFTPLQAEIYKSFYNNLKCLRQWWLNLTGALYNFLAFLGP